VGAVIISNGRELAPLDVTADRWLIPARQSGRFHHATTAMVAPPLATVAATSAHDGYEANAWGCPGTMGASRIRPSSRCLDTQQKIKLLQGIEYLVPTRSG
jgi:hypothetical protein